MRESVGKKMPLIEQVEIITMDFEL